MEMQIYITTAILIISFALLIVFVFKFQERNAKKYETMSKPKADDLEFEKLLQTFCEKHSFRLTRHFWSRKENKHLVKKLSTIGAPKSSEIFLDDRLGGLTLPKDRYFWELEATDSQMDEKILLLPSHIHTNVEGLEGYIVIYKEIPEVRHEIIVKPDYNPFTTEDHRIESNRFNWKYVFDGTERKMLTEIFDPVLIEFVQAFPHGDFYMRMKQHHILLELHTVFAYDVVEKLHALLDTVYERYLKSEVGFK